MPRRDVPDPTASAVGRRIRELRGEKGLTAERLAFESELGSKGFLSDIEQGRASPSLRTLQVIADYLNVSLVDLFTFPERGDRDVLIDRTRWLTPGVIRKLIREMPEGPRLETIGSTERRPTAKGGPAKTEPYPTRAGHSGKATVAEPVSGRVPPTGEGRRARSAVSSRRRSKGSTPVVRRKGR